jgi:hypothetical protein
MLIAAFAVLGVAVLLGSALAILHLREDAVAAPPWPLAALHGLAAVLGFGGLLLALQGSPRGAAMGTAAFGAIAAVLLALALLFGIAILAVRRRGRRRAGALIGVHATLAVMGFVVLFVYVFP